MDPQIQSKDDLGISLPGGAMRACVYSLGVLRALHKMGILERARYISSVSGSSWLTSIYSYQTVCSTGEFLGEYICPENLTLDKLSSISGSNEFANVLHDVCPVPNYLANIAMEKFTDATDEEARKVPDDCWSQTLGQQMHKRYNLYDFATLPTLSHHCTCKTPTFGGVLSDNGNSYHALEKCEGVKQSFGYHNTQELRKDAPFLIINACAKCDATSANTSLEFTPMYYGMPVRNNNIRGSGLLMEPYGLLSFTEKCVLNNSQNTTFDVARTDCQNRVLGIVETAGISSNCIPARYKMQDNVYDFGEFAQISYANQTLQLLDGAAYYENSGIIALLRRRVQNIIMVCPVCYNNNMDNGNRFMIDNNTDLTQYFAKAGELQVFRPEDWTNLQNAFYKLIDQHVPLVAQLKVSVVQNLKYGIVLNCGERYCPTITFIHPSRSNWTSRIPKPTANYINRNNDLQDMVSYTNVVNANFIDYPLISFYKLNYSTELVNAMSQNACYDVLTHAPLFSNNR